MLWAADGDPIPGGGSFSLQMCVCSVTGAFVNYPSLDLILGTELTPALFTPSFWPQSKQHMSQPMMLMMTMMAVLLIYC